MIYNWKSFTIFIVLILFIILIIICHCRTYSIESFKEPLKRNSEVYSKTINKFPIFQGADSFEYLGNGWYYFSYRGCDFLYHWGNKTETESLVKIE